MIERKPTSSAPPAMNTMAFRFVRCVRIPAVSWHAFGVCMLMLASGCDTNTPSATDRSPTASGSIGILPYAQNPYYWQYHGRPVLLLGGSDQDNLFNHPDLPPSGLERHLDLLQSVGGNYVRNTMSSRDEGNPWAFRLLDNGLYDLGAWNEEYWKRFEHFLEMTEARDIIVQIEIWDRFDFANQPWNANPFNPSNNVNYSQAESGIAAVIEGHPGRGTNSFFRSTPGQENNEVILPYQRAFVDKLLSISLSFRHVLYTISNETNESPVWSAYWADFIREKANERGVVVHVTEMWDPWDLSDPLHGHTFDDAERYTFVDISQNNHQVGQAHWDNQRKQRERIASSPRPMNNVKIYAGSEFGSGPEEGTRRFWRNVFGGSASSRFHRPGGPPFTVPGGFGIGLNSLAQSHIRSMRTLTDEISIFSGEPRPDLLSSRDDDQAYAMSEPGSWYAVYFPDGGVVILNLRETPGFLSMRWLDILSGEWSSPTRVSGGGILALGPPVGATGPWAAVLIADSDS